MEAARYARQPISLVFVASSPLLGAFPLPAISRRVLARSVGLVLSDQWLARSAIYDCFSK